MKPHYGVEATVQEDELDLDLDLAYWHGSERFTGVTGETLPGGNYAFQTYREGKLDGPSGEVTPDGDLVVEEWYRKNVLYGITRRFRQDGTLATATGYEYGTVIWTVRFDLDGRTVLSTDRASIAPGTARSLESMHAAVPLPPLLGPEHAADLNRH